MTKGQGEFLKRIILAAVAAVSVSTAANAQAPQVFNWSGFYMGGSASYMHAPVNWQYWNLTPAAGELWSDTNAVVPAFHAGWNWQRGNMIYGIEASMQLKAKTAHQCDSPIFCAAFDSYVRFQNVITVGPRVGHVFNDRTMGYVTAGYAYAHIESGFYAKGLPSIPAAFRKGHNGYFVGAGVEYAWSKLIVVGVEYMFMDLSTELHTVTVVPATGSSHYIDPMAHMIRFRVSLKDPKLW